MRQHQNAHLPSLNGNVKAEEVVQQDVGMEAMPTFLKASSSPSSSECQFMPPQLLSPIDVHGEHLARCVRNVSIALHERLDDFVALLINPSGLAPITTTVGVIERPLGLIRMEVIHLFVALFATSDYSVLEKCSQLHILKLLTVSLLPVSSLSFHTTKLTFLLSRSLQDLFFEYSHNNQLHKYYEQIIEYLFQNYSNFKSIYNKHKANEVHGDKPADVVAAVAASSPDSTSSDSADITEVCEPATATEIKVEEEEKEKASSEPQEMDTMNSDSNEECASKPPNNEKILYFEKLYSISQVLVKQVIGECRLIEKILDSYAQETIPVKSQRNQPQPLDEGEEKSFGEEVLKQELHAEVNPPVEKDDSNDVEKMEVDSEVQSVLEDTFAAAAAAAAPSTAAPSAVTDETEDVKIEEVEDVVPLQIIKRAKRPGYMGHLRLIANVLKDRCPQELLEECELSGEVLQRWTDFKAGKLAQLNELIANKLVEETKYGEMFGSEVGALLLIFSIKKEAYHDYRFRACLTGTQWSRLCRI